jgi:hypothetical protein
MADDFFTPGAEAEKRYIERVNAVLNGRADRRRQLLLIERKTEPARGL